MILLMEMHVYQKRFNNSTDTDIHRSNYFIDNKCDMKF